MAKTCACPICEAAIDVSDREENELLECPECGTTLEIVSLAPPLLEEAPEEEEDWGE